MIDITNLKGLENLCGKGDPRYQLDCICIKGSTAYACNGCAIGTVNLMPRDDELPSWFGIPVDDFKVAFKIAKKQGRVYVTLKDGHYILAVSVGKGGESRSFEFIPIKDGRLVDPAKAVPDEKVYTPTVTLAVKQLELLIKQAKAQGVGSLKISINESDKRSTPVKLTALDDPRINTYVMPVTD